MSDETKKLRQLLLLSGSGLTPALVEALQNLDPDVGVDVMVIEPGVREHEFDDRDGISIGLDACEDVESHPECQSIDVSSELIGARSGTVLLDNLRFDLQDPKIDEALGYLSHIKPEPLHHRLNQPSKRPGREGKQPKVNRRSMHDKRK